ncbi:uncharacterized protein LOC116336731 [Contarinia nasturtii]|uniref:uncharacterized protein LOC116336731 n=1 Tax=Contarinia nasturtii TaxID=265458 RepID=UPI0012D495FE|nr:uncharacterized protein LOC116336731 [Contarinia nasturtii]
MFRLTILFAIYLMAYTCQIQANSLTEGLSTFASDLYKQCAKSRPKTNILISPFCVSNSLALLAQGSKGQTYDVLKNGLHFMADRALMPDQFNETYTSLSRGAGSSTLTVANKVYLQNGYQINRDFQNVARKKFHADIENINFSNSVDAATKMNTYVEDKTNHMIKDFIKPEMVGADSRLVLINALYFKGNWEHQFDEKKTSKGTFYLSKTQTVEKDFMYIGTDFNYAYVEELNATAVQLKYENSHLSFVIVLPIEYELDGLESKLENYNLAKITEQMEPIDVDLYVPKFKLQYEVSLNKMLTNMGMGSIFSEYAELSGLIDTKQQLKVSDVIHKTVIDFNEKGSEAAAASGVQITAYSYPANFTADHPFFFYIWDDSNKMPIFTGRFLNFENGPVLQTTPKPIPTPSTTPSPPGPRECKWWSLFCFRLCGLLRILIALAICTASIAAKANMSNNKLIEKGVPKFSMDLYQQCARSTNGNIIISPFSVVKALELLSKGARGNTYEEIKTALYLNDLGKLQVNVQKYIRLIRKGAREATLSIANRIFVQNGYTINKKFLNSQKNNPKLAPVRSVEFSNNVKAAETINQFVESKTNHKIKDFINPSMLNSLTRVVLVNAIYFRGNWEHQFDKQRTHRNRFYLNQRQSAPADFMFISEQFNNGYIEHLDASTLQMNYANSSLSMVFVLPTDIGGLPALESKLANYDVAKIVDQMEMTNIEVTIPKFKIEYESSLKSALQSMGLTDMFTQTADFSDLLEEKNVQLYVSDVFHKAYIEVDESGTEAAAATGIHLMDRTLPPSFTADHPFFFFIYDSKSRTTVFSGRVTTFN